MIKMNANDFTPEPGITPTLAAKYARWLADLGIDAVENSCGSGFCFMGAIRGEVPVKELTIFQPPIRKVLSFISLKKIEGKFDVYDGFNLEASRVIKPALGKIPLMAVGGMRNVQHMEGVINQGQAEFISICRPFIREPLLVKKIREGKTDRASCKYCNKCFAAVAHDFPLRCYHSTDFSKLKKHS
jgi:2,4-dienoyl-CoA reductase-like NADH-dependent reductase (Old Yellow Enzyme family)